MDISYRPCAPADLDFILELKRLAMKWYIEKLYGWDEAVQREKTRAEIEMHGGDMRIITSEGTDVGVTTFFEQDGAYVMGLIILRPEYSGRGIGTAVIGGYIDKARAAGKKLLTKTYKHNPARRLYERLGFKVYDEDDTHVYLCTAPE